MLTDAVRKALGVDDWPSEQKAQWDTAFEVNDGEDDLGGFPEPEPRVDLPVELDVMLIPEVRLEIYARQHDQKCWDYEGPGMQMTFFRQGVPDGEAEAARSQGR